MKFAYSIVLSIFAAGLLFSGCELPDNPENKDTKTDSKNSQGGSNTPAIIKRYGDSSNEDMGEDILPTKDGGYLLTGYTTSHGAGSRDVWLLKTDADGNMQWNRTYGDIDDDEAHHIIATKDGGYLLVGNTKLPYTTSFAMEAYVVKIDADGHQKWAKNFGGEGNEDVFSAIETDDGYVMVGMTSSYDPNGYPEMLLMKIGKDGSTSWPQIAAFGDFYHFQMGYDVTKSGDGGYVAVGTQSNSATMQGQLYVVKTDGSGKKIWEKTYGSDSGSMSGQAVVKTANNQYIIAGFTNDDPMNAADHIMLKKISNGGNPVWEKTYEIGKANDIVQTSDGGYLLAGYTTKVVNGAYKMRPIIIKTDANGNEEWNKVLDLSSSYSVESAKAVVQQSNGDIAIAGFSEDLLNDFNLLFGKF